MTIEKGQFTNEAALIRAKGSRKKIQQEKRLYDLGATEESIGQITSVIGYFDEMEYSKTIPARDEFYKRIIAISQGVRVPLVVFNCLDFSWQEAEQAYPSATILDDTSYAISAYFRQAIQETVDALENLSEGGGVDLCIIVPDSELFDTRVFPFAQTLNERIAVGEKVKSGISQNFSDNSFLANAVMYWSEYCNRYGLLTPAKYTTMSADRLRKTRFADSQNSRERNIYQTLQKQTAGSVQYFVNNGLKPAYVEYDIPFREREERTLWYCAMYMGEGKALADSGAIVLNLEDLRVRKWYNIGSNDRLPIITPVNPNDYYRWRNAIKSELSS